MAVRQLVRAHATRRPVDPLATPSPASTTETITEPLPQALATESTPTFTSAPTAPAYWPRKLLDTGPAPVTPIILPAPEGTTVSPEGRAILELFINASGQVDRIDVIESDAPPDFTEAAKATFLQAHFTPGFKDNVNVPSRIKIEVGFDQGTPSP